MVELSAQARTDGQRIADALESIAESLKASAAIDPAQLFESLMSAPAPPELDDTPVYHAGTPDDDERIEEINNTETIALPLDGYSVIFEWATDDEHVFRLWLAGPGGTVQPLEWRHG